MSYSVTSVTTFFVAARNQAHHVARWLVAQLLRTRRAQLAVAGVVSFLLATTTGSIVASTRAARARWTHGTMVLVAARDIASGRTIRSTDVEPRRLPPAMTPDNALTSLDPAATLRISITAGTALTASMMRTGGIDAEVPRGWRVVAMPDDIAVPKVEPGSAVDVIAGDRVVATDALVATVEPISVAVPSEVAATVAAAARMGEISLVSAG